MRWDGRRTHEPGDTAQDRATWDRKSLPLPHAVQQRRVANGGTRAEAQAWLLEDSPRHSSPNGFCGYDLF